MIKLLTLSVLCAAVIGVEVPQWIKAGILAAETKSSYNADGTIRYVDKRRGSSGERGPFQITKRAHKQVRPSGYEYWRVETDYKYAEEIACKYLEWLYDNAAEQSWDKAIEMYNALSQAIVVLHIYKLLRMQQGAASEQDVYSNQSYKSGFHLH